MSRPKLSILIPAYNEERTIIRVLEELQKVDLSGLGMDKEIIVVDDGSRDKTGELIQAHRPAVTYIRHPANRGKGAAIRTAIAAATGSVMIVQDADLEYKPEDFTRVLTPIMRQGARAVYGSRFLHAAKPRGMGLMHYVGNHFLTGLTNLLYGSRLTDMCTCYKAFPAEVLRSVRLECEQFDFCPEVTAKVRRLGVPILEVPIQYSGRQASEGKKIAWPDGIQAIRALFKYRFMPRRFFEQRKP